MHITRLRQADLNLLVYLVVLVEERSISRAAQRLRLSQPAVSRALTRLRHLFKDDLLVRTPSGYEPTPRGQGLLDELASILPRLEYLISGTDFDPERDAAQFHLCTTDNAAQLYGPILSRHLWRWKAISFLFQPWSDDRFLDLDRNRLDLVLDVDVNAGASPKHLHTEMLFEDEFVCVAAKDSALPPRLSWKQYLAADHISVNVLHGQQTLPELTLARLGKKRRCVISVPYFMVALRMVVGTPLLVTLSRRLAQAYANPAHTRLLLPPREIGGFRYLMFWHPRQNSDARHRWLRQTMRVATRSIPALLSSPNE